MRIGEVCGLRWCDVDFETGLISIRHSVAYAKGMGSFIKDTKTHDARGIPIDPVGLLPFLKEIHEIDRGKLRSRNLTGAVEIGNCYILSEPGAAFATASYIRRAFKTFSETNGLMGTNDELITFHGLRHTFATQWIRQGGDIKALQSILGHKDAMATLNVYADIEPISKIHNMLRVSPCLWRGYLGPRVDPGPMFQQRIQESIETLQAFGYGVTEPDDRNIVIRDVKTISRLYPTEYAAVLGPSQLRSRWSDRGAARGMRRGAVSPPNSGGCPVFSLESAVRRSADCGNGLSARCVRLSSEINPTRAGRAPDGSSPCGLPPHAHVADV